MGAQYIEAHVDSMLVANHIDGSYEAREPSMILYLQHTKELMNSFLHCKVTHVRRSQNKPADALSKMASTAFDHMAKDVRVEVLAKPSVPSKQVNVIQTGKESWITPIMAFLTKGILPSNKAEARKLQHKALHYEVNDGILYRRSYLGPLLRCVDSAEATYLIKDIHKGSCRLHAGPRMVVAKLMNAGYYWPEMHMDAVAELRKCKSCQRHAPGTLRPKNNLIPVTAAWPFQKWAIDLVGPFPTAPGNVKYLVVAIDYFTKWVEAKPLASIDGKSIKKFIWEFIICRFGLPMEIVSDNGTQFADQHLQEWLSSMNVKQIFTSVAHPQGNGQVECANRSIVEGIKTRLGTKRTGWVDELPHVLWADRTLSKTSNGETPFSLMYGTEAEIPAEMTY